MSRSYGWIITQDEIYEGKATQPRSVRRPLEDFGRPSAGCTYVKRGPS